MRTSEIKKILDKILPGGILKTWDVKAIDQLNFKNIKSYPSAIVFNTKEQKIKFGGHWVCLVSFNKTNKIYFDSFGRPPPKVLRKTCQLVYNKRQLQSLKSSVCGQFSIYVVYHLSRGVSFKSIIRKFKKNKQLNDKIVNSFVKKY